MIIFKVFPESQLNCFKVLSRAPLGAILPFPSSNWVKDIPVSLFSSVGRSRFYNVY